MHTDKEIKENIRMALIKLRKANNLKGEDIASVLGINPSTYRSWELGRSCPKQPTIVLLSKIYNVSCDYILTGELNSKLSVANDNKYNKDIYGDSYMSQLSPYEKSLLMKIRILNLQDKQKVSDYVDNIMKNLEDNKQ